MCLLSCEYYYYTTYSCDVLLRSIWPAANRHVSASSTSSRRRRRRRRKLTCSFPRTPFEDYCIDADDEEDGNSFGFGLKTSRYATQQYAFGRRFISRTVLSCSMCKSIAHLQNLRLQDAGFMTAVFVVRTSGGTQIK